MERSRQAQLHHIARSEQCGSSGRGKSKGKGRGSGSCVIGQGAACSTEGARGNLQAPSSLDSPEESLETAGEGDVPLAPLLERHGRADPAADNQDRRRIVVVRHGSRPDSHADPALDARGEWEAEQVADYFSREEAGREGVGLIGAVYCSPFRRAMQTAAPVSRAMSLPICIEWGFCELLAHLWLHARDPLPELRGRDADALPGASHVDKNYESAVIPEYPDITGPMRPGNAKQREKAVNRHRLTLDAVLKRAGGGSLLIVGHAATHDFVAAAMCPREHSLRHHTPFCVPHCGLTELVECSGGWRIVSFGATPWASAETSKGKGATTGGLKGTNGLGLGKWAVPGVASNFTPPRPWAPPVMRIPPPYRIRPQSELPGRDHGNARKSDVDGTASGCDAAVAASARDVAPRVSERMVWLVVGGEATGGIVVREGKSLQSAQCSMRLQTGARVEQVEMEGDRVQYRKLFGAGPDAGWVSRAVQGKELLQRE